MDLSLEGLNERLRYLEDLESIRCTWLDYCTQLELGDLNALGEVFTEDGVLETIGLEVIQPKANGIYRGRRAIISDFYSRMGDGTPRTEFFNTGHLSTNMQIELKGDEAITIAYWFEIILNNLLLIGTYPHRLRRESDRWQIAFMRICVRYRARLEATDFSGQSLREVVSKPVR
jgi:hypothetical protein